MSDPSWGFATRAMHAGDGPDPTTGARAVPIYQSSSLMFGDTADDGRRQRRFRPHVYPACGDAFFNDTNPFAYNADAAALAWPAARDFLAEALT